MRQAVLPGEASRYLGRISSTRSSLIPFNLTSQCLVKDTYKRETAVLIVLGVEDFSSAGLMCSRTTLTLRGILETVRCLWKVQGLAI